MSMNPALNPSAAESLSNHEPVRIRRDPPPDAVAPLDCGRIVVTGAAGLMGRHLSRLLLDACATVRGVDRHALPTSKDPQAHTDHHVGDLLDRDLCAAVCRDADVLIHTAARQHHSRMPRRGRERFFAANVTNSRNLVLAAQRAGVRHIILLSSDMVYGLPPGRPMTESDVPRPIGPYGRSKLRSEQVFAAARDFGCMVTIFRPRLILGPGRLGVMKTLFDRVRLGRVVPIFGDGRNRYQMIAAGDVAAACLAAIRRRADGTFNLGSDQPPTVRKLLGELCRRAATGAVVRSVPARFAKAALWTLHGVRLAPLSPEQFRIADVDYLLDTSRTRDALDWKPRLRDDETLWQAYEAYLAGRRSPVPSQRPH